MQSHSPRSLFSHRYDFDKHHDGLKHGGPNVDMFTAGYEARGLLAFFGDLTAARNGIAKVNDAHKRILALVKQGVASAEGCVQATCSRSPVQPFIGLYSCTHASN